MKICQPHWDAMRAKLDELGIGHIGAHTGKEAMAAAVDQLQRAQVGADATPTDAEWDPLMAMNYNFWHRALEIVGLAAMAEDFGCPLCHARANYDLHDPAKGGRCGEAACQLYYPPGTPPTDQEWIDGCAVAMRDEARRRGLVAVTQ